MRISDWSSDVCSSDLAFVIGRGHGFFGGSHYIGQRRAGQVHARRGGVTGRTGWHGCTEQCLAQGDGVVGAADWTVAGRQVAAGRLAAFVLLGDAKVGAGNGTAGNHYGPWRPALVVDLADPVHEGDDVGYFLILHVQVSDRKST